MRRTGGDTCHTYSGHEVWTAALSRLPGFCAEAASLWHGGDFEGEREKSPASPQGLGE